MGKGDSLLPCQHYCLQYFTAPRTLRSSIHPCLCIGGAGGSLCAGLAVAFAAGFAAAFAPEADSESRRNRIHQDGQDDNVSCKQDLFLAVGHNGQLL